MLMLVGVWGVSVDPFYGCVCVCLCVCLCVFMCVCVYVCVGQMSKINPLCPAWAPRVSADLFGLMDT